MPAQPPRTLMRTWLLVGIACATAIAYYQVLDAVFVWDTIPYVIENPWLRDPGPEAVRAMFSDAHRANWQPLVWLSHALDFYLFGDNPAGHHAVNVLMHLGNAMLVYALVLRLAEIIAWQAPRDREWLAFLTAMLFAIHPQHVESVAWVVERKDVLYSLLTLGCYLSYLNARERQQSTGPAYMLFILAVMAKPMAITIPLILILFDLYPLRRTHLRPAGIWQVTLEKWHYFLVAFAVLAVTLHTQAMAMATVADLPLWARLANTTDNTLFYLLHYIAPVKLSPLYPYPAAMQTLQDPLFWGPGALFLIIATTTASWCWLRYQRLPLVCLGFYLATLAPVSGIVHVGPAKATDHYVYLATLPLSLLTAVLVVTASRYSRSITLALAISYLIFLLAISHQQVRYWNNPLSLWTRVVQLHPDSALGHRNLAAAYVQIGDLDRALSHAEQSLTLGGPVADYVDTIRAEIRDR